MMSNDAQYPAGCSNEFAELCALSTSGELSIEETAKLREHVKTCGACAALLGEYASLAHVGMVKLAMELEPEKQVSQRYREKKVERRFIAAYRIALTNGRPKASSKIGWPALASGCAPNRRLIPIFAIATAAVLLLCVAGAFELGRRIEAHSRNSVPIAAVLPTSSLPNAEKPDLQQQLIAARKSVDEIRTRFVKSEKRIAELSSEKASLLARVDELTQQDQASAETLGAITQQRDSLQQQLSAVLTTLGQLKRAMVQAQQDRQGALLQIADLETEIGELHAEASNAISAASEDEKFLAEDRDIRELMGARQLYIADVFDVQNDGRRSKPFGRIFYTKGKSLIFYAFDLQTQPGYRDAKAFQAWGKRDNSGTTPVSLGIFYLDNEQKRRWVLKSDNPDLLAKINAVFVTVEPHGGSQKPTGKPFLEAYLHSLSPNHP